MPNNSHPARLVAVGILLGVLAHPGPGPLWGQSAARSPGRASLDRFVGVWEVVVREPRDGGGWSYAGPTVVQATTLLRDKFVAIEGFYALPGHERPLGMVLLLSQDPFQDLVRVTALDDFVGLLDGYSGRWQDGRLVVTNLQCDTTFQGLHGRLTFRPDEQGGFEIHVEASSDRGATWRTTQVATFARR